MTWNECKKTIQCDLDRLNRTGNLDGIKYLITNHSFKITFWFRIGSFLYSQKGKAYKILLLIVQIIYKHYQYLTGIQLSIGTKVGPGLTFTHFSCIVINKFAQIGKNCTIYQGVTIGTIRGHKGYPIIGNNVVLSSGVSIIGNVKIGNNVIIGAGSVVTKDIPDNAVAIGIPAKVISYNGPDHIKYFINDEKQ